MKNWRTTINGLIMIACGIMVGYVTIAVMPWGNFPADFPSEAKTGLMMVMFTAAGGLITGGVGLLNSRDNAESEKAVERINAQHNQNAQAITQISHRVDEVKIDATKQAEQIAERVAEKKAEEVVKETR